VDSAVLLGTLTLFENPPRLILPALLQKRQMLSSAAVGELTTAANENHPVLESF